MTTLPRWNLSKIYPGLDTAPYRAARADYEQRLTALEARFDQYDICRVENSPSTNDADLAARLDSVLRQLNAMLLVGETLGAFLYGLITTDSYDTAAAKENSQLEMLGTRRQQLEVRLKGWLGSLAPRLPALLKLRPELQSHRFFLEFTAAQSRYLMSEPLEALAAELCLDAGTAFGRLQGNITSQLKVPFERDGVTTELPIAMVRNLSFDPDPVIRERAYHVEQKGWESIRTTVAACMNGVKGTSLTLAKRRGRPGVLEVALDQNRIDRETLDALLGAIREFFPVFRGYLRAKANKLGRGNQLPWWDLFAPVGSAERRFTWTEARAFIVAKFSSFSSALGQFAARAFDEEWIDAEPRVGKRGGAYCMPVPGVEESRVLANFDGSFEQLMTLAHELGHAFHNDCQRGLEMLRRGSPSTLAETASIFCETLATEAALPTAAPAEQLMILEAQIAGATQVCLDISSRYIFETAVFARRGEGELSADEFCELMRGAQSETYGDAVDPATYHPYMWLWKPHYYSHEEYFYNFPYAFGHLFGLGLYAVYQQEGAAFVPRYMELLRDTGQNFAAPLAERFGLRIREREFWRGSLRVIEGQIAKYAALK